MIFTKTLNTKILTRISIITRPQLLITSTPRYYFVNMPSNSKFYHTPLPKIIDPCLILCQKQPKLEEKMVILEHITELIEKDPRLFTNKVRSIMVEELKKWENSRMGRMEKVVTIAWLIKKLNLQNKLSNLYQEVLYRVKEDEWYVTMEESIKGLQTFWDIKDQQLRDEIYEKLQRNVSLTVREVNMKYYQRIFVALVEAGRFDSMLFDHLEKQVLKSLGMAYDTHTIMQIINCYAISRQGSDVFYEVVQEIMYKGHAYSRIYNFTKIDSPLQSSGQYLSTLAQTYAIVQKFTPIPLNSDFLDYLYKSLMNPKTHYQQLSSITKILLSLPAIQFQKSQVKQLSNNIIFTKQIKHFKRLEDIYEFYEAVQQYYDGIPVKISERMYRLVIKEIQNRSIPVVWAIQATNFLLEKDLVEGNENLGECRDSLIDKLIGYIDHKYKYLNPEDQAQVRLALQFGQKLPQNIKEKFHLPQYTHKQLNPSTSPPQY